MFAEQNKRVEDVGKVIGQIFSFFLFTSILFFILFFVKNDQVSYMFALSITGGVTVAGLVVRRALN